jgi:thiol-disulfide isomerase/thioredoxin
MGVRGLTTQNHFGLDRDRPSHGSRDRQEALPALAGFAVSFFAHPKLERATVGISKGVKFSQWVRSNLHSMRAVIALVVLSYVGAAQPLPDARTLYDRVQAAAKSFHSLQYTAEMTMESGFLSGPVKLTIEVAYLNPGKTRMEIKTSGTTMLNVSDGETTWVYNSMNKQYAKIQAALGPAAVMAVMGVKLPDISLIHPTYKTIGEETVEIDGQKHECWLVEMQISEFSFASGPNDKAAPPKVTGAVMTSWIDKKLGIDIQFTLAMKMQMGGKDVEMHQKVVKKGLKIDQPLDAALFTFTPPPDAKEVKELRLFGMAAKSNLTGKPAPAFEVKTISGETFSLAALKGRPVLLDFWATWCGPCRRSMPVLEKISLEFKNSDLVILGVNTGEDREAVEEFLKKTPFEYPAVLSGESGILESYKVTAYPTFILIGRDGKIVANEIGFSGEDQLRQMIDKTGLVSKKQ